MNISRVSPVLFLFGAMAFGQGSQLPKYTVGTLPTASSVPTYTVQVIDGSGPCDCTTGGGSYNVLCTVHSSAWIPAGGTCASGVTSIVPGPGITCSPLSSGTCLGNVTIGLSSTFAITSFTGCSGSLELGQTVSNPTCSATYSGTPTSATITNTDSVDSPLTLVSPYTNGTIAGSFSHAAIATTTITLTAVGASTLTATQTYTWNPRIFAGVGASGATSATASGTSAVLNDSAGTIASAGLHAETVGETFGPFTASGQVIYLLLMGSSHTFTDALTGFPFAMNAPISVTFVNQYGVTQTMYLYASTNTLTGTFEPKVTS